WRRSSPTVYSRCWRNSTDCPKYGLRCIPERKPSTICRARRSSREIRLIASGCKNLLESGITGQLVFLGRCDLDEALDDVVRRDPFALGGKIEHEPMPQHGLGQGLNVVGGDVRAAVQEGPRLGAQDHKLHRPRPGAPAH